MKRKRESRNRKTEGAGCTSNEDRGSTAHKIIVGVDYGTTFTGVGFVATTKSDIRDVVVITSWPGTSRASETVYKIPSRIAYPNENYRIQNNKWGFQVESGMISYSWTKLLLDKDTPAEEFDDETLKLQEAAGMPILKLPVGKDAVTVAADFLRAVYNHTITTLEKQITAEILAITPMELWFTIPAIWSDEAQNATREAAKRAGFGSRAGDKVFMITEPEAAAIAALKETTDSGTLASPMKGDGILVCDCGGGTVDITTYLITETCPSLAFEELCTGTGAKCGSTSIDRGFYRLMLKRFGDAFRDLPLKLKGPGSNFMSAFDRIKQDFGSSNVEESYELPLDMSLENPNSEYFDDDERLVRISGKDMEALFDPVVEKIKLLVRQQIQAANHDLGNSINKIILVGGFGDSEYLRKAIYNTFYPALDIQVIVPNHPQAAVVKGAVYRGLDGACPTTRRCRRHYGYGCGKPFREGIDAEKHAYIEPLSGKKYADGRMEWIAYKGEKLAQGTTKNSEFENVSLARPAEGSLNLYSCSSDDPPERVEDLGVDFVGNIVSDLSFIDPSLLKRDRDYKGTLRYVVIYDLEFEFGAKEGVLKFRTLIAGNAVGEATIDFGKD